MLVGEKRESLRVSFTLLLKVELGLHTCVFQDIDLLRYTGYNERNCLC